MQLHQLRSQHKKKTRKRVGRGGKRGTYSGRGIKGQKARAGHRLQPIVREVIKRYPKLRGYRVKSRQGVIVAVNVGLLNIKFNSGDRVTPEILLKKRIIRRIKGRAPKVKILGGGEIKKAIKIAGCLVSKQARQKVEKSRGIIS